jgi:DNA-binding CsgD family transcriptional regulator
LSIRVKAAEATTDHAMNRRVTRWLEVRTTSSARHVNIKWLIWRERAEVLHRGFVEGIAALARAGNRVAVSAGGLPQASEVTSIVSAALGLTGRELEVVAEVLRGSSTKEIATNLRVSSYTVQDHLKAIFSKAGVNSHRELIAGVFFGVYAPRLGTPVSPTGFFADPAGS